MTKKQTFVMYTKAISQNFSEKGTIMLTFS